jgi:hypothetical protein
MSDDKKPLFSNRLTRTSFTMPKGLETLGNELRKIHLAGSMSNYIQGLIALDWLETKKQPLDLTAVPAWIIVAYKLDVVKGKVQPRT